MALLGGGSPNIGRLERRGDVDRLRAAIRHERTEVRAEAARALAQFDDAVAVDGVAAALADPDPGVRVAALDGLTRDGARVEPHADQLVRCVVSRSEAAAGTSARALDLLSHAPALQAADLFVHQLLEPDAPDPDEAHRATLEVLLLTDERGEGARSALASLLIARLAEGRGDRGDETAERMLGWLGETGLEPVMGALDGGAATPALLRTAGRLGDVRAVDHVVRALESDDQRMRTAAAEAARSLNHTRAVPALLAATQDEDQSVRNAASEALDRMGTAAVIAGLAAVVRSRDLLESDLLEERQPTALDEAAPQLAAESDEPTAARPPAAPAAELTPQPAPELPGRRRGGLVERLLGRYE